MSDDPPLAHLDVFPLLAVAGVVTTAAVLAAFWIGADTLVERGVAVVATGALLAGCVLWVRDRLARQRG